MTNKKPTTVDGIRVYCTFDKLVSLDELRPNPDNPNMHPDEQIDLLSHIILTNGWRDRITVSNLSGYIVKGHGRYLAAVKAGLSKAPVDFQDYETDLDEAADLIADNKISELSYVDNDVARGLMDSVSGDEVDFETFGFSLDEIKEYEVETDLKNRHRAPEVIFSEEILLEHNYVVLYFDNSFDWQVAVDKFGLKQVKDLIERKGQPVGIGRVLNGAEWLDRIK
jgi:ParB-like chromosome segregation protein Spo0J